jgi:hypothetical protein
MSEELRDAAATAVSHAETKVVLGRLDKQLASAYEAVAASDETM